MTLFSFILTCALAVPAVLARRSGRAQQRIHSVESSKALGTSVSEFELSDSDQSDADADAGSMLSSVAERALGQTASSETALSAAVSDLSGLDQTNAEAMLNSMAERGLARLGSSFADVSAFTRRYKQVDETALNRVAKQLPADVEAVVRLATQGSGDSSQSDSKSKNPLNDTSIAKGRVYLNKLAYESVLKTDDIIWECKEFELRNRGAYEQATTDSARLASQLNALNAKRLESNQCIVSYDADYRGVQEQVEKTTQDYNAKHSTDFVEITRRKNDLAVFEFIINVSKCPAASSSGSSSSSELLQVKHASPSNMRFCMTDEGMELNFGDPDVQARFERTLTPSARLALRQALGQISGDLSFLQLDAGLTTTTIIAAPMIQPLQRPVNNYRKCADMPPDPERCGRIHDKISLEWGMYKDDVDALATEMATDTQNFETATTNFNSQMTQITDRKTECMETLATSISGINADTSEKNSKDKEIRRLSKAFNDVVLRRCKSRVKEQMGETCDYVRIRNSLLDQSSNQLPSQTIDCEVSNFVQKDGVCYNPQNQIITCDDTCPQSDPNLCGGLEDMVRSILNENNTLGIQCPPLTRRMRCGQKKCPVNCLLSQWSGFSKCSRECEGGMQMRTRSLMVMAKNGGRACDTVQETRSCNTMSCDRDCTLVDWTEWSPCSMACSGGWQGRTRSVLVPIRGEGRCPREASRKRWQSQQCNTQACAGDELCIAQQDLVIALDASGSVKQAGFDTLKNFSVNLTQRYTSTYFGIQTVKMGATLFGNGQLLRASDNSITISPALLTQELTFDLDAVRTSLKATTWQKGFTNMAQALSQADFILSRGGRETAQSAVLVLSDGKPSFKFHTSQKAQQLKDKHIQIYMAPVMDAATPEELATLQGWASHPWQTNFEMIPGIPVLTENADVFVQKLVVKFCPDSSSPGLLLQTASQTAYMLVHESGINSQSCGSAVYEGVFNNINDCAAAARARGSLAFNYGKETNVGKCLSASIAVDQAYWNLYLSNRTAPPCTGGTWVANPFYDTYVLNPSVR